MFVELEMPWGLSSSLSSLRSCAPITGLVNTSAGARCGTSPSQHSSRTLDSSLWRKQVCEVRPNRSSTLGRFPAARQFDDGWEGVPADDKTTVTTPRLDTVSLLAVTVTKSTDESLQRCRAPRPPARSSADCCRCRWLQAASTSSPTTDPGRCRDAHRRKMLGDTVVEDGGQERTSHSKLTVPPPPPPPPSVMTSSQLASTASSVTSPTVQDLCVHLEQVESFVAGTGSTSCLLHASSAHLRTPDLGLSSVANDGRARYCLEDIREMDETSTIDHLPAADHQSQSIADDNPPRLSTSCTFTTFV